MDRGYFLWVGLILLGLTLIGFGDNLVTDIHQPSNSDPKFIVHGLFCLAWMIILPAQAALIRGGNPRLHRRLGTAAMLVLAGVVLSTAFVFWAVWKGWPAMSPEVKANRLLLPGTALLGWLGYRNRRQPDTHKRLMLAATFFMLGPILGRTFDPLLLPFVGDWPEPRIDALFLVYFPLVWSGFFLSLLVHDWRRLGRIHPVSGWSFLAFGLIWAIAATA